MQAFTIIGIMANSAALAIGFLYSYPTRSLPKASQSMVVGAAVITSAYPPSHPPSSNSTRCWQCSASPSVSLRSVSRGHHPSLPRARPVLSLSSARARSISATFGGSSHHESQPVAVTTEWKSPVLISVCSSVDAPSRPFVPDCLCSGGGPFRVWRLRVRLLGPPPSHVLLLAPIMPYHSNAWGCSVVLSAHRRGHPMRGPCMHTNSMFTNADANRSGFRGVLVVVDGMQGGNRPPRVWRHLKLCRSARGCMRIRAGAERRRRLGHQRCRADDRRRPESGWTARTATPPPRAAIPTTNRSNRPALAGSPRPAACPRDAASG